jgi:hypothetical protein
VNLVGYNLYIYKYIYIYVYMQYICICILNTLKRLLLRMMCLTSSGPGFNSTEPMISSESNTKNLMYL